MSTRSWALATTGLSTRGAAKLQRVDSTAGLTHGGTIRILGFILVGAGLLALVFGGFSYTRRRDTVELGPLKASVRQRERFSIPPILGATAVIAGVGLIVLTSRRRK